MSNSSLYTIMCALLCGQANAQSKINMEEYNYWRTGKNLSFVPMVSFENKNHWYVQGRYNYERDQTMSLHLGRSFSKQGDFSYNFVPIAGVVAGKLNGVSIGLNMDLGYRGFFAGSQSQYMISYKTKSENFLYNWSEIGYSVSRHFFTGLSIQYTGQADKNILETGLMAGAAFGNISFPLYVFSPFSSGRNFILGLNYKYSLKKKNKQIVK